MGGMLLRHEPTSASIVRRELTLDLSLHGVDDESIDEVALVASELVGNAIRHAGAAADESLDVTWTVGSTELTLCVEDASTLPPVMRSAETHAQDGRGLTIVSALTSAWGYEPTERGKLVWAKVPLRHAG